MYGVTITEIINKMSFKNLTPELDTDKIVVSHPDINRPALQLTGSMIILTMSAFR